MSPLPEPIGAQKSAIERRGDNIALRSGAGCGKTFVLARRFTELLLAGPDENPLSRLVALTFTEKAAGEMIDRIRRLLSDRAAAAAADGDRERFTRWLDELPEARISTIHGFCAALLRVHAVEAGVDPNFAVCADEMIREQMLTDAVERAVLQAVESDRRDVAALAEAEPFGRIADMVARLVRRRTSWSPDDYRNANEVLARWSRLAQQEAERLVDPMRDDAKLHGAIDNVAAAPCDDETDKLAVLRAGFLDAVRDVLHGGGAPDPDAVSRVVACGKPGNIGGKKAWGSRDAAKAVRDGMKEVAARFEPLLLACQPQGELDRRAAESLVAMTHLAGEADALYAAEKRRRGLLDFDDLLVETRRLLADRSDILKRVRSRIDQLLMDEAQDTDAFQIAMVELLAFGAIGLDEPPAGRLFLVGDDKQSIYRFRGARVEAFEALCRRLGETSREVLDVSFRTHPAGVAFVNHLFGELMGDAYEPLTSYRTETPDGPSVEVLLAAPAEGGFFPMRGASEEVTRSQAALTAQRIAEMIDGGERLVWDDDAGDWRAVRPRDVAILFARMTHSLAYERELARRGVPYYVVAGTGFFNQQEVYDVLNVLRAVDNPHDDIAFVGVLRGGMFALDDNAMLRIADALDPPYLPALAAGAAPPDGLPAGDRDALGRAVALLTRLHRVKDAVGIDELIDAALCETAYEGVLLSQFQGKRMLGNVRRLAAMARSASEGDGVALADFIAQMDKATLDETRYEQAAVAGEAEDVVTLVTIHKAKGLEFPAVFVPDLNAGRRPPRGALLERPDWGITYGLKAGRIELGDETDDADTPLSHRLARRREADEQEREDLRKLYVAVTRHEDHLVLVGADQRDREGERLGVRGSFLEQIDAVLGVRAAVDAERSEIPCGDGKHALRLRREAPAPVRPPRRKPSPGEKLLAGSDSADDLAAGLARLGASHDGEMPLAGPLPVGAAPPELAVTALSDFQRCPTLFRWRHELRVEALGRSDEPATQPARPARLDPLLEGTLLHRCMELLDFGDPQPPEALLARAAAELDVHDPAVLARLDAELTEMVRRLEGTKLWSRLTAARQTWRELDFLMDVRSDSDNSPPAAQRHSESAQPPLQSAPPSARRPVQSASHSARRPVQSASHSARRPSQAAACSAAGLSRCPGKDTALSSCGFSRCPGKDTALCSCELAGPARLRGQIDLLYETADGELCVLDYKSDRVAPADIPDHAEGYRLQVLLYALAAGRRFGRPPTTAALYFLRPGVAHELEIDEESLQGALDEVTRLASELTRARRTGQYERRRGPQCRCCAYAPWCERHRAGNPVDDAGGEGDDGGTS